MVTTKQRPTHTPPNPPRRRAPAIRVCQLCCDSSGGAVRAAIAGSDDEGQDVIDQVTTTLPPVTTTTPPAPTTTVDAVGFEPGFGIRGWSNTPQH